METETSTQPPNSVQDLEPFWLAAPVERTAAFQTTFTAVSLAIQELLRTQLPLRYFTSLEAYLDVRRGYPMLLYSASAPLWGRERKYFHYDVLDPDSMRRFYYAARGQLTSKLKTLGKGFKAQGRKDLAMRYSRYESKSIVESVRHNPKSIHTLLVAEGLLINQLIEYSQRMLESPRARIGATNGLLRSWAQTLRRASSAFDASGLAPELFRVSTAALRESLAQQNSCELIG